MSAHELEYKGKTIRITVSKNGPSYVGTYRILGTDPPVTGTAADSNSEEGALTNAENTAREKVDAMP